MTYTLRHTTNAVLNPQEIKQIMQLTYTSMEMYTQLSTVLLEREATREHAVNYFKKVFPLPSKVEYSPIELLSKGEKSMRSRALAARDKAFSIYNDSPTQENIRNTEFGLWQSVIEYADHGNSRKDAAIATISARNDGLKLRALELLGA